MSSSLAVAMVTATLGRTLGEALAGAPAGGVESAAVTTLRPDLLTAADGDARGVNLFLYQVSPNGDWTGSDLPTRSADGTLLARPRQALRLDYLLTFSGDDRGLEPQRLLGLVVGRLAARPVLSRELVRAAVAQAVAEDPSAWEQHSTLADQVELVRLSPLPLTLEDLSHLWSTLFQAPYRLSVTYQASVVLLESDATPSPALPVRGRRIDVLPVGAPSITRITAASGRTDPVLPGATLRVEGRRLRGPAGTRIRIGEVEVDVPPDQVTDAVLTVDLPAGVPAGVRGLQVLHPPAAGSPAWPLVVRPIVAGPVTVTPAGAGTVALTVPVDPPAGRAQRVVLTLNEADPAPDRAPRGYAFPVAARDPAGPATTTELTVPVPGVAAGDYLVRVQVDGAESTLETDAAGRYDRPRVVIP